MIVIIILVIMIVIIVFAILYNIWKVNTGSDSQYIKFKTFIAFYNINPERWELSSVFYNNIKFVTNSYHYIYYKFNFIDFYRYRHWYKQKKKRDKKQKELQNMNDMIRIVKSDIAKLEAESQANMQSAANSIRDITSRM